MEELNFEFIGKRIREVRISKGLTQEYLANAANVNTSHISNIENNRVKISLSTLVHVCNAMNITVDYILATEYTATDTALNNAILKELQNCDNDKKEKILKIIQIL